MPARDRPAGDGDEQKREEAPRPDRAGAVDELGQRGHLQFRPHDDDADRQQENCADFEERRQIIARREHQPNRQHRGDEAVADDDEREVRPAQVEPGRERWRLRHRPPVDERHDQQRGADRRHLADPAGADEAAVDAHDQRDREGAEHREGAPRAALQRIDHHERQHRQDDDADQEDANPGDAAGDRPHLRADHFGERLAVSPNRQKQHRRVLHRAGEHHAGQDPQRAGKVTHLRGQHRPDQWPGAGDRREMMAEQDIAVGRDVIEPIVMAIGWGHAPRVHAVGLGGDEQRIEPVGDEVDADRRHDQPGGVDRLPRVRARQRRRKSRPRRRPPSTSAFRATSPFPLRLGAWPFASSGRSRIPRSGLADLHSMRGQ